MSGSVNCFNPNNRALNIRKEEQRRRRNEENDADTQEQEQDMDQSRTTKLRTKKSWMREDDRVGITDFIEMNKPKKFRVRTETPKQLFRHSTDNQANSEKK